MLFHDENKTEGIEHVMEEINNYSPSYGEEKTYFLSQGVAGDQLSIERGINHLLQVANGLTPEERKEGLHMEVADFHAQMKFLQVFLSTELCKCYCTLFLFCQQ